MEKQPPVALLDHFAELPEPRREHRRRHNLSDILVIAVCAVLCEAESYPAMEDCGHEREEWLQQFLELPQGIPSHDTFNRVLRLLDPVQFQFDPELYSRLFAEVFLYLRQQRPVHPWHGVVIYPSRAVDPGEHPHYQALLHSGHVTRVYLDEWAQPRQTLSQQLIGVLLADPSQAMTEAGSVLGQLRQAHAIDTALTTAIVNLVETILVYKLPMLSREEIQTMLELTDIDLKQTRFYQEVFAEGRQEGRQEGEQAGWQKGRQEEGVTLLLRLLQRRCGELAPEMRERMMCLSLPQLEALGEALLEFRGLADLEQWLAAHGGE